MLMYEIHHDTSKKITPFAFLAAVPATHKRDKEELHESQQWPEYDGL